MIVNPTMRATTFIALWLAIAATETSFCNGSSDVGCIETERQALLTFKRGLENGSNSLASWISSDGDCCQWGGVVCDNFTGHILELHLMYSMFGKISPSLLDLKHLIYLNLGNNELNGTIPSFLGELSSLKYLVLSYNKLNGSIPSSLRALSSLQLLDLSNNKLSGSIPSSLGALSFLKDLDLSNNKLNGPVPSSLGELSSLEVLDLSINKLNGPIPSSLGELSSLEGLYLNVNELNGTIPSSLGALSSLQFLVLSHNKLNGLIPSSFGEFSSIVNLDLSNNELNGSIPSSLGQLSSLTGLDLSWNKLNGTLYPSYFSNLTGLTSFDISQNSIVLKLNSDWVPPFQLGTLRLASCHLGPQIPFWLHSLKNLYDLDLSNTGIVDTVPSWFSTIASQFMFLNLSHNQIHGEIPNLGGTNLTDNPYGSSIDLSSNNFSGSLPRMSFGITKLDLSSNALSGSISQFLCHVNESGGMAILYLRDNLLSGELPDCWMNWPSLIVLNLANNKFTGNLPVSLGTLIGLRSLHLRKNSLSGTIPDSLLNCTELEVFDVGENEFVGNVPIWLGKGYQMLVILNLRSNKFNGPLPSQLCHMTTLQILDIAYNNLSGTIPRCISNFSAMVKVDYSADNHLWHFLDMIGGVADDELLTLKGQWVKYDNTLNLVRIIDFSSNNFSGEIPTEVTNLKALQSLNLSHNFFVGRIPEKIGVMRSLESIDFSTNQLSGEIPQSISDLTFLSHLNLSNNNLMGKIPLSTQIQGFDASCFIGNELCGSPLPQNCTEIVPTPDIEKKGEKDGSNEVNWFYVSMTLGFVMGFWSFIGPLLVNRRWRYMYCSFLDHLGYKLCSAVNKCW